MMRIIVVSMASLLMALAPKPAHAYDPDTHFQVTYVLCRAAGFTHADALTVAQYDQGMDDSNGTLANTGITPHIVEEGLWHALPAASDPNLVITRKNQMFEQAVRVPGRTLKLQYLGVFYHYQQDTWAHRVHPNDNATVFSPYTQPLGHGLMGHQPDRPPFDPICALRCLEEGINYARQFLKRALSQTPSPMFDNYSPALGSLDTNWRDTGGKSLSGKFIHQIAIDNSNTAHKFTTTLIRAQIDSYTNGIELGNPNYTGYNTSNEADYATVRENLQAVCRQFNIEVQIPDKHTPFTTLTTKVLLEGVSSTIVPLPTPPVAAPSTVQKVITIKSASNSQFICATDGLTDNQWLYCKSGTPVSFTVVGPLNNCVLKVSGQNLYFSYNATTGAVKLWSNSDGANFSLERQSNGTYAIKSLKFNQYVWLSSQSPYITGTGKASNTAGQWYITGL